MPYRLLADHRYGTLPMHLHTFLGLLQQHLSADILLYGFQRRCVAPTFSGLYPLRVLRARLDQALGLYRHKLNHHQSRGQNLLVLEDIPTSLRLLSNNCPQNWSPQTPDPSTVRSRQYSSCSSRLT